MFDYYSNLRMKYSYKKLGVFAFLLLILMSFSMKRQRLILIGDSTMAPKQDIARPEMGWGEALSSYLLDDVEVINLAKNGRSTQSFISSGEFDEMMKILHEGDMVIIQYGHNDAKVNDPSRYAAAESQYKKNLEKIIKSIESKQAIPILLTSVVRRKFDDKGILQDTHGNYIKAARDVAVKNNVMLLDMEKATRALLEKHGVENSKKLFLHLPSNANTNYPEGKVDDTHFNTFGAHEVAKEFIKLAIQSPIDFKKLLKTSEYGDVYQYKLPTIYTPVFRKDTFDIRDFGAVQGVQNLVTQNIQTAIDSAHLSGGGVVVIPQGLWVTGPLRLKSFVNLHLLEGSLLQYVKDRDAYPVVETTWEGKVAYRCHAPIWCTDCTDVAITGKGLIDGAGDIWKSVKRSKLTDSQWQQLLSTGGVASKDTWYPSEQSKFGHENTHWTNFKASGKTLEHYLSVRDFLRPNMISFTNCFGVIIEGVTFKNSPAWTLHPLLSKHITIKDVQVINPWFGQNNDALDLESCSYALIDNCTFDTGDDAITLKSGRDEEGRKRGVPTAHVIIKNTKVHHGHGGFVIGSEMSGGVHDVFVKDCVFSGTDIGLRFKSTRGRGGTVKDIYIKDVFMNDIPGNAIDFNLFYAAKDPVKMAGEADDVLDLEMKPVDETTPLFTNIFMDNIHCYGAQYALYSIGLPEMNVKNITLTNSTFKTKKGVLLTENDNVLLRNISLTQENDNLLDVNNSKDIQIINVGGHYKNKYLTLSGTRSLGITIANKDITEPSKIAFKNVSNTILKIEKIKN
jgi:DNA sulfur modification protein DndE